MDSLIIDTDLQLRRLNPDEAPQLFTLVDENRDYLRPWLPWVDRTMSVDNTAAFIDSVHEGFKDGSSYGYGIMFQGTLVGHMSLMDTATEYQAKIGYWISQTVAGHGITTRAVTALTQLGFDALKLPRLTIHADVRNEASNRVAEKCGYLLTNKFTDRSGNVMNVWTLEPKQV